MKSFQEAADLKAESQYAHRVSRLFVWCKFWDNLFARYFFKRVDEGKPTMFERHRENIIIAKKLHDDRKVFDEAIIVNDRMQVRSDLKKPIVPRSRDETTKEMERVVDVLVYELSGVDCYWDGEVEALPQITVHKGVAFNTRALKPNSAPKANKFGVLRITAFPFVAAFRYEECNEEVKLSFSVIVDGIYRKQVSDSE